MTPSFSTGQVYKIQPASYDSKEYLLIENRQLLKWDELQWGDGGIVIWHVNENDESVDDTAGTTRVRVVQADGRYDLENAVNLADADDLWIEGLQLGDDGEPNIKSVVNGNPSGLLLSEFSPSQEIARFRVSGLVAAPPTPFPQFVCSDNNTTKSPATEPSMKPDIFGNETIIPTSTLSYANETISPEPSMVPICYADDEEADAPLQTPRRCSLSVGAEFCDILLENINPDPSCDCHNFCGGKYVGCCRYSFACPIICPTNLIAGCVFPQPTCQPGRAPSPFPTVTGGGEALTPEPSPEPSSMITTESVCMISASIGECPALMRAVDLDSDCTCYNFCNGLELPCCKADRDCPPLSCNGDFVAGCRREDKTPTPRCLVQSNTASCSTLTAGQQYYGGSCDCANYCNGKLIDVVPLTSTAIYNVKTIPWSQDVPLPMMMIMMKDWHPLRRVCPRLPPFSFGRMAL